MPYIDEIYQWANQLALLPWLLMMIAPNWKWTKKIALGLFLPALFALAYLILFILYFKVDSFSEFSTLDGVLALFSQKEAVLVGWLHYLAFDLLVGTWEYADSKKSGIPHLLLVPCLVFTLMAGPVGFLMYLGVRFWKTRNLQVMEVE